MRETRKKVSGHDRMTQTSIHPSHGCTWSGSTPQEQLCRWIGRVKQESSSNDSTQPLDMVLDTQFNEISNDTSKTMPKNNSNKNCICRNLTENRFLFFSVRYNF